MNRSCHLPHIDTNGSVLVCIDTNAGKRDSSDLVRVQLPSKIAFSTKTSRSQYLPVLCVSTDRITDAVTISLILYWSRAKEAWGQCYIMTD